MEKHRAIVHGLLAAHVLSGWDTVPTYFRIGKGTVLEILDAVPDSLTVLGKLNAPLSDVVRQSAKFIASCYSTIAEIHYKVWAAKFGNTASSNPVTSSIKRSVHRER